MIIKRKLLILLSALGIVFITTFTFDKTQSFYKDFSLGKRYFAKNEYAQAIPYLLAAFKIDPAHPDILGYLIPAYEKTNNKQELVGLLILAARKRPEDGGLLELIGDTYYSLKDHTDAEIFYRQALDRKGGQELERKLIEVLIWQQKYDEGMSLLKGLIKVRPDDLRLVELFADANSWSGNYGQAITLYNELLEKKFRVKAISLKIAEALRLSGEDEEAIKFYNIYLGR